MTLVSPQLSFWLILPQYLFTCIIFDIQLGNILCKLSLILLCCDGFRIEKCTNGRLKCCFGLFHVVASIAFGGLISDETEIWSGCRFRLDRLKTKFAGSIFLETRLADWFIHSRWWMDLGEKLLTAVCWLTISIVRRPIYRLAARLWTSWTPQKSKSRHREFPPHPTDYEVFAIALYRTYRLT